MSELLLPFAALRRALEPTVRLRRPHARGYRSNTRYAASFRVRKGFGISKSDKAVQRVEEAWVRGVMSFAEIKDPAPCHSALLIIDMINDLEFADGPAMFPHADAASKSIRALSEAARRSGVPIVYVNDNYGQWHSEQSWIVQHCSREGVLGRDLVERLRPEKDDYFVIKPQFSGFYSTNLPVLLPKLGAQRLILTGVSADICVLFTAADAHMREYDLWVPSDCVAGSDPQRTDWALEIMRNSMKAETKPTDELRLSDWLALDDAA